MLIIRNDIIPPKGFAAINICGMLFARKGVVITDRIIRHEKTHTAQMLELMIVFFYLWYVIEWVIKLPKYGAKAYQNISFEREAYQNQNYLLYNECRERYSFINYL